MWTTPIGLKTQVQKLWDRGLLLASTIGEASLFPRRLTFKGPNSRELSEHFSEVRDWINQLSAAEGFYRIEWRKVNHCILGSNKIPVTIWIDELSDALGLIGKRRVAEQFATLVHLTQNKQPELLPWLAKRPMRALELAEDWPQLLKVVDWLLEHPRPAIYLRQIDLPGIHTKFIERHCGILTELLDFVSPKNFFDKDRISIGEFCRHYGFIDKPSRVRFRVLDANIRLLPTGTDQDITLTQADFASLNLSVSKIFITENEINFLAFPNVPDAIVVFGAGYGFNNLADASWLLKNNVCYWGDIDTHGFAILNQLREFLPHAISFLMDQRTLLAHKTLWGVETQPKIGTLKRLNAEESVLYDQLCQNYWGKHVRLEQERIGFNFLICELKHELHLRIRGKRHNSNIRNYVSNCRKN